jgi:uncharacterized protein (DUF1330 family)
MTIMIDFPILASGYSAADRDAYAATIQTVGARHGVRHFARYDTVKHANGKLEGAIGVNLWEMDSPSNLEAVLADDVYTANIATRDELHDMARLTMFLATPTVDEGPTAPGTVTLLDLPVLNPGISPQERAEYSTFMKPLFEKYGVELARSYQIDSQLRGEFDEATELNILTLPDIETVGKLTGDPIYQANLGERDRIHNMDLLTMIIAKAV